MPRSDPQLASNFRCNSPHSLGITQTKTRKFWCNFCACSTLTLTLGALQPWDSSSTAVVASQCIPHLLSTWLWTTICYTICGFFRWPRGWSDRRAWSKGIGLSFCKCCTRNLFNSIHLDLVAAWTIAATKAVSWTRQEHQRKVSVSVKERSAQCILDEYLHLPYVSLMVNLYSASPAESHMVSVKRVFLEA